MLYSFSQDPNAGPFDASALVSTADTIYGTVAFGGNGDGSIFAFNPATNSFAAAFSFDGTNGRWPNPQLLYKGGLF